MKRFGILMALLLVALASLVWATGPVRGPSKCEVAFEEPLTSSDGSPLTDLLRFNVYIGTTAAGDAFPATPTVAIPAPRVAPVAPAQTIKWDCRAVGLPDGQKWATVRAVDTAGNESGNATVDPASGGTQANGLPFVFDALKPGVATGVRLSP